MASTIILSDNGASSGSAGLKETGGNDGVLILQTTTSGGTATNAVYIDTTQDVGIGTNTPVANTRLHVHESASTISRIRLTNSTTTDASGKGLGVFQNGVDTYITNNEVGILAFSTSGTQRMQINAGAPILCLSGGNTSATGTGIAFPATQSASSDANTLDDYEEGTWTPTYIQSTTNPTVSYGGRVGVYRKIGSFVWVAGRISADSVTGGSGIVSIGGLPFAVGAASTDYGSFNVGVTFGAWPASSNPTGGYPTGSLSQIVLATYNSSDARGGLDTRITSLVSASNANGMVFSACYFVA